MSKTRRTFTPEFKAQAVKLVTDQGKSPAEVARDLDLGESMLRAWKWALAGVGGQGVRISVAVRATIRQKFRRVKA